MEIGVQSCSFKFEIFDTVFFNDFTGTDLGAFTDIVESPTIDDSGSGRRCFEGLLPVDGKFRSAKRDDACSEQ